MYRKGTKLANSAARTPHRTASLAVGALCQATRRSRTATVGAGAKISVASLAIRGYVGDGRSATRIESVSGVVMTAVLPAQQNCSRRLQAQLGPARGERSASS